jgi:hypothetical protein
VIVMDTPQRYPRDPRMWCHILSDLLGDAGRAELREFARSIGLKDCWLQHEGEPNEHYDTYGGRIELAREAGAKLVRRRELAEIVQRKRLAP